MEVFEVLYTIGEHKNDIHTTTYTRNSTDCSRISHITENQTRHYLSLESSQSLSRNQKSKDSRQGIFQTIFVATIFEYRYALIYLSDWVYSDSYFFLISHQNPPITSTLIVTK